MESEPRPWWWQLKYRDDGRSWVYRAWCRHIRRFGKFLVRVSG